LPLQDIDATAMVGNLPYNIAATTVLRVLEQAPDIRSLTVMTQREVGERLAAAPGSRLYGQTSVLVAYWGRAKVVARVSRTAFYPVPNVDSVLVRVDRGVELPPVDRSLLFGVIRAAFGQRRKVLRNSLAGVAGSTERAERVLEGAGIDAHARAEMLTLEEFVAIAKALD
jgi:16S rRNA (adenine1518-N6/adenine1519-N6)-dimethyltransferase